MNLTLILKLFVVCVCALQRHCIKNSGVRVGRGPREVWKAISFEAMFCVFIYLYFGREGRMSRLLLRMGRSASVSISCLTVEQWSVCERKGMRVELQTA